MYMQAFSRIIFLIITLTAIRIDFGSLWTFIYHLKFVVIALITMQQLLNDKWE